MPTNAVLKTMNENNSASEKDGLVGEDANLIIKLKIIMHASEAKWVEIS